MRRRSARNSCGKKSTQRGRTLPLRTYIARRSQEAGWHTSKMARLLDCPSFQTPDTNGIQNQTETLLPVLRKASDLERKAVCAQEGRLRHAFIRHSFAEKGFHALNTGRRARHASSALTLEPCPISANPNGASGCPRGLRGSGRSRRTRRHTPLMPAAHTSRLNRPLELPK